MPLVWREGQEPGQFGGQCIGSPQVQMLGGLFQRTNPGSCRLSDKTVHGGSNMATENRASLNRHELLALRGLRFPGITLQALKKAGIYSLASVSIEHQRSVNRYVIRGQESGGAVAEVGAYCGFVGDDGNPLPWLQRVDTLAVNGIHARVVAAILVRVQVVRVLRTYDLLITKHTLRPVDGKGKI